MDVTETHTVHEFKHERPLISCLFNRAGDHVFAGSEDFKVWRFRLADGSRTELNTDAWVRGLALTPDGKTLITGGYDGRLIWWPVAAETPEPIRAIEAHDGWVRAVAVSPDGTLVASVGNDLKVRLWNADDGTLVREMAGHESHIYNVIFHPEGKRLVTGDLMANLIDWDVETGKRLRTWKAESLVKYDKTFRAYLGGFRGMSFSPDGKRLACSGMTNVTNAFAGIGNPSIVVFDWEKGEAIIEQVSKGKLRGIGWGVALHPEGITIAAIGGQGGYLLFWNPEDAEEFHQFKLKDTARDLDLSPDGVQLATAHYDGNVRIHRMEAKAEASGEKGSG